MPALAVCLTYVALCTGDLSINLQRFCTISNQIFVFRFDFEIYNVLFSYDCRHKCVVVKRVQDGRKSFSIFDSSKLFLRRSVVMHRLKEILKRVVPLIFCHLARPHQIVPSFL